MNFLIVLLSALIFNTASPAFHPNTVFPGKAGNVNAEPRMSSIEAPLSYNVIFLPDTVLVGAGKTTLRLPGAAGYLKLSTTVL